MRSIEQTGRNVEDAVRAALKALGVTREQADVEVLAEESRGLLGILGHTEAKVRVTAKPGVADKAEAVLSQILHHMGLQATPEITSDDAEGVQINIRGGSDLGLLIGKRGQTLAALQLITAMIANRDQPMDSRKKVILDAEGYRERRERALTSMAHNAAERAKRTGREVRLEALTPRERRIVHMALAEDPGVSTRSEGEDPERIVIVAPKRSREDG
jgi:spoIIIJ-associated protein